MISHISIRNFAIIRELELDLHPGLNIITGETGAGKSIIIEAVSMALGSRADTDYIRMGADKATISIVAEADNPAVLSELAELGVPADSPVILNREISSASRSLCRINGQIVPLSALSNFCKKIVDIHGQYDHQSLLNVENHIDVLDLYGRKEISPLLFKVRDIYRSLSAARTALDSLKKRLADSERQKDLMRYELSEIEAAAIKDDEDEQLQDDIKLMQHSEAIYESLALACDKVYESDNSAMSGLSGALAQLQDAAKYSKDIAEAAESFADAYYRLDDLGRTLRDLRDSVNFSQQELNEKTERLDSIERLKRKYGGSIESIRAHSRELERLLGEVENADAEARRLKEEISAHSAAYEKGASELGELRRLAAQQLSHAINAELKELNFKDAEFSVLIEPCPAGEKGSDYVEFLIKTNKGEASKPLAKIASGGELSRIMLALKRVTAGLDGIPTMIFDEIDTGISGATAGVVGQKLKSIAREHQIICITHLPQIAAMGDHHYKIAKVSDEISTHTTVVPLTNEERIEELAALLSGTTVTDAARKQAEELLKRSS